MIDPLEASIVRRWLALAVLILAPVVVRGQSTPTLAVLHSFSVPVFGINSDGGNPSAGLVLSGNTLFGTTAAGGSAGFGTIFRVNTDGSRFTNLYSFTDGADGAEPQASLVVAGTNLYGTARSGGAAGYGTVFSCATDGSSFTALYSFTNGLDGANPAAGLVLSGGFLYGTSAGTGDDHGSIFQISTNGTGFEVLHQFSPFVSSSDNADGASPSGPLVVSGNLLYGTTGEGGSHGSGTVFAATLGQTNLASLYNFLALSYPLDNASGAEPEGGVVLSGSALYGTTYYGGSNGYGVVFAGTTGGGGFAPIYTFTGGADFGLPSGTLTLSGSTLYGTTPPAIFALSTSGNDFTNLHEFVGTSNGSLYTNYDGLDPNGGLVFADGVLYGTAYDGGADGYGTVFAVSLLPPAIPLKIEASSGSVILTWTNAAFLLQAAGTLSGVYTNVPNAASPFTNAIGASPMFFRLVTD